MLGVAGAHTLVFPACEEDEDAAVEDEGAAAGPGIGAGGGVGDGFMRFLICAISS